MKIAVIADIHENFHNLILALKDIEKRKVQQILVLGDLMNGGVAKILASQNIQVFSIWGNNDGDKAAIVKKSMLEGSNLKMGFETFDSIEIDGKRIFLTHYPMLARPMAKSGEFDAVFYGHDHVKHQEMVGECLVANPGEISAHRKKVATYLIYDTKDNSVEFVELKDFVHGRTDIVEDYVMSMRFAFRKP